MQLDPRANCWLETADGSRIGPVEFDQITIARNVDEYDVCVLDAKPDQPVFTGLSYDDYIDKRIVVERAGSYVETMRTEGVYFVRSGVWRRNSMTLTAFGPEYLLESRIVAYPAGDTNSQMTGGIDNIMRDVVSTNLGTSSTDTTRTVSGISVGGDVVSGATITRAFAHYNVLSVLTGLRETSRALGNEILFRMERNGTGFIFVTYANFIGVDRRTTGIALSEENNNFSLDGVGFDATNEITYMYAGGSGQRDNRWIGTANDAARLAISRYNRREAFYNCNQDDTQDAVDDAASQELARRRARRIFSGEIKERKNYRYGVEWDFGDLLRASHDNKTYDVMVRRVLISITPGGETITARVEVDE